MPTAQDSLLAERLGGGSVVHPVLAPATTLPAAAADGSAVLVGRAWLPGPAGGPTVVALRGDALIDLGRAAPTMSDLLNAEDTGDLARHAEGAPIGSVEAVLRASVEPDRRADRPYLLAPVDLQAVKAAGVTFAASILERVIEEHAGGAPERAAALREELARSIGGTLRGVVPGSEEAARLKAVLTVKGLWSQYLEVGLGPDAEIFTKCQPMAAVGTGADIGIHPRSAWNNPEPELILLAGADGQIAGATLGNDVNLRDFEGRSALLLNRAKDVNASCAIGPFIRLFDRRFTLDQLRRTRIDMTIRGDDGFMLDHSGEMAAISRDLEELMRQCFDCHAYPDGVALFTGTMFVPIADRDAPGSGFTHKRGDIVTVSCPLLGSLTNRVEHADRVAPWRFGASALMRSLAARGRL